MDVLLDANGWPIERCDHRGCQRIAKYHVGVKLRPPKDFNFDPDNEPYRIAMFTTLKVCATCRRKTDLSMVLTDELRASIIAGFHDRRIKPDPDWPKTTLHFLPWGTLFANQEDVQAERPTLAGA